MPNGQNPSHLPNEDVLNVALRTAQDFSDFLDGQNVRCIFHVHLYSARLSGVES